MPMKLSFNNIGKSASTMFGLQICRVETERLIKLIRIWKGVWSLWNVSTVELGYVMKRTEYFVSF
jgi:hypothetical protein